MTARVTLTSLSTALLGAAFLAVACGRESVTTPNEGPTSSVAVYGKAPTNSVSVTSASPAFGDQGTTVDVHVFGSGFTDGAQATWLLHGVADPGHVHTNKTTVLSSTELVANITIASDASLSFWDVQVALAGGKNGVGSECFEVTSAQILGPGTTGGDAAVMGMNDLVQVSGVSSTSQGSTAWYYDASLGMVSLGGGGGRAIDPLGAFVVGENSKGLPTAWLRQPDNSWLAQNLPLPTVSVGATPWGTTRASDGTVVVVGANTLPTRKSAQNLTQPVVWQRAADGTWSAPTIYATPSGTSFADARDVNPLGEVVGHIGYNQSAVWENPTTYTILDGTAGRINQTGTLIVGQDANHVAVYWWRDPGTHQWHLPATPLPSLGGSACPDGFGLDVNDAGVIVGWSCAGTTKNPTVWKLDLSGSSPVLVGTPTRLPGLGVKVKDDLNAAKAVTNSAPFVVTGQIHISSTQRVAVQWNLR